MAIPQTMADLSAVAENNSPAGSDPVGNTLDDFLRAHAAIIRSTNALAASSIGSAPTTNIGAASAESVQITGTTTITSFGTAPAGIRRECRFSGSLTITHSSNIQLPNAEDITTQPGDVITFRSLGSGQWIMTGMSRPEVALSSNVALLNKPNVFTAEGTSTDPTLTLSSALPILGFRETDQGTDNKNWDFVFQDRMFRMRLLDDATLSATSYFTVTRSGMSVTDIALTADSISLNGVNIEDYARLSQQNEFTVVAQTISSGSGPRLILNRTNAPENQKRTYISVGSDGSVAMGSCQDGSIVAVESFLTASRSGTSWVNANLTVSNDINLNCSRLRNNGVDIYEVASRITGSTFSVGRVLVTTSNVTLTTGIPGGRIGCIYNSSGSSITIGQGSGLTLRLAGTSSTGSRTLAPRGFATVWTNSTTEYIISGAGLS